MDNFKFVSDIPEKYTGVCYIECSKQTRWYKDGKFHREEGPAIVGDNKIEQWFINDLRHRLGGFAVVYHHFNNLNNIYYIHGDYVAHEDYWKDPLVIKHKLNKILDIK